MMIFIASVALIVLAGTLQRAMWSPNPIRVKRPVPSRKILGVLVVLPMILPGLAGAHGNVTIEEDNCVQRVGGNLVHFNAYQPQHAAKAQYCTEIPGEGDTFLVVDLVDPILRNLPIGVRVIKGMSETSEEETVAYWPPTIHPDGVLRGEAKLAKGLYKLIIAPEGFSSSSYLLRVQQIDYATIAHKTIGPITIILLFVVIGYEFSKSRSSRNGRILGNS
ncbi:MAG: hypothetical protein U0223_15465 [Nitrospira sp.]|nr:hypothetical protein [Nitrospira sp.]